ncbi:MAG: hypothetical protein ACPG6V_04710 [Flavobacteriales bacterium]
MKKIFLLIPIITTIFSCGYDNDDVSISVLYSTPAEDREYQAILKEIATPFENTECEKNVFLKPFKVGWLQSTKKPKEIFTEMWENPMLFEDYKTVDNVKNHLGLALKKVNFAKQLGNTKPKTNSEIELKQFIQTKKKKNNIIIYSEDYEDSAYDSIPVFNKLSDVRKAMMSHTCDSKKILLLVKPFTFNTNTPPEPEPGPGSGTSTGTTSTDTGTDTDTGTGTIIKSSLDTKYAHYSGGIENGKMHGKGSLTFTKDAAIPVSRLSTEQPSAKKGQKVVGIFNNGNFESGDLFDKNGKKIKAIFIGK